MEFWGVEVKAGKPLSVQPELGKLIHISQASLGEVKKDAAKGTKSVPLRMKIDGKDFIIGTLAPEERPQLMFDLVFEKEFELSHDCKTGSVYFIGYTADEPNSDIEEGFSSDESEEELVENKEIAEAKIKPVEKAAASSVVPNGAAKGAAASKVVGKKAETSDSDDEEDSDDEMALDESLAGDSSDDLSGDDSEEELVKAQPLKKRPAQAAAPVPSKKAKASTPTDNKTGNKKGQNATPNSAKPVGKTSPFGGNKSNNKQSPKSGGQFSGGGNKNFNAKNGGKGKRGGK